MLLPTYFDAFAFRQFTYLVKPLDGDIYLTVQQSGARGRHYATTPEEIEWAIRNAWFGQFATPRTPGPMRLVGPHQDREFKIVVHPNGLIRVFDLGGYEYQSADQGLSWKWYGAGDPPAGFFSEEQGETPFTQPL